MPDKTVKNKARAIRIYFNATMYEFLKSSMITIVIIICSIVFIFPKLLAGITILFLTAKRRNPVTISSRHIIMITTQHDKLFNCTNAIKTELTSNLSTSGSINFPKVVIKFLERAIYPSSASVRDEIIKIMTDTVCTQKTTVRINGENIPSEIVKSRFLKITNEHIEYICDCLNKNTTQITNIRAYLLTVLYNSTATIDNYYKSTVNHDLYGSDF